MEDIIPSLRTPPQQTLSPTFPALPATVEANTAVTVEADSSDCIPSGVLIKFNGPFSLPPTDVCW